MDLDGTLAEEQNPFQEFGIGAPIPAMVKKVQDAIAKGELIKVFTARLAVPETHDQLQVIIRAWTKEHVGVPLDSTCVKDPGMKEIWDDRARGVVKDTGEFKTAGQGRDITRRQHTDHSENDITLTDPEHPFVDEMEKVGAEEIKEAKTGLHPNHVVQIDLPPAAATEIIRAALTIPDAELGTDGREDDPHITVKFGVKDDADALTTVAKPFTPFGITLGKLKVFSGGGGQAAIVAEARSPELLKLHDLVDKAIGHRPDDWSYSAHVTLAYVKPEFAKKYEGSDLVEGIPFAASSVTLSRKGGERTTIPLGKKTATLHKCARLVLNTCKAKEAFWQHTAGHKFVKEDRSKNEVLVSVNVAKLDQAWSKDPDFYIGPGGSGGISNRYPRFQQWLKDNPAMPIEAPIVSWNEFKDVPGFTNGRHRFSVLRDMGAKRVYIAVPKEQAEFFEQKFAASRKTAHEDRVFAWYEDPVKGVFSAEVGDEGDHDDVPGFIRPGGWSSSSGKRGYAFLDDHYKSIRITRFQENQNVNEVHKHFKKKFPKYTTWDSTFGLAHPWDKLGSHKTPPFSDTQYNDQGATEGSNAYDAVHERVKGVYEELPLEELSPGIFKDAASTGEPASEDPKYRLAADTEDWPEYLRGLIQRDLFGVGPNKPLGYMPMSTVQQAGIDPDALQTELEQKGLVVFQVHPNHGIVHSGAIWVYDESALSALLQKNVGILKKHKWPEQPDGFVKSVIRKSVGQADSPDLYRLVGQAFSDERFKTAGWRESESERWIYHPNYGAFSEKGKIGPHVKLIERTMGKNMAYGKNFDEVARGYADIDPIEKTVTLERFQFGQEFIDNAVVDMYKRKYPSFKILIPQEMDPMAKEKALVVNGQFTTKDAGKVAGFVPDDWTQSDKSKDWAERNHAPIVDNRARLYHATPEETAVKIEKEGFHHGSYFEISPVDAYSYARRSHKGKIVILEAWVPLDSFNGTTFATTLRPLSPIEVNLKRVAKTKVAAKPISNVEDLKLDENERKLISEKWTAQEASTLWQPSSMTPGSQHRKLYHGTSSVYLDKLEAQGFRAGTYVTCYWETAVDEAYNTVHKDVTGAQGVGGVPTVITLNADAIKGPLMPDPEYIVGAIEKREDIYAWKVVNRIPAAAIIKAEQMEQVKAPKNPHLTMNPQNWVPVNAAAKTAYKIEVPKSVRKHFWEEPPEGNWEFWAFRSRPNALPGERIVFTFDAAPIADAVVHHVEEPGKTKCENTGKFEKHFKIYWLPESFRRLDGK